MDIKKKYDIKDKLECKIASLTEQVKERWSQLIGFGCGYFHDWYIEKDNVCINYGRPRCGGMDVDDIPLRFFEIEDTKEAVVEYKKFLQEERDKSERERKEKGDLKEKEEYERLKQKFEVTEEK